MNYGNIFEKLNNVNEEDLLEMANVTGKYMKIEDIDFSFYFSKKNPSHGIRIKISWNRDSMTGDDEGYMELDGDYIYYQPEHVKYRPKSYEIETVRYFAKRYKVLFSAVWESKLDADTLSEYFKGRLSWSDLLSSFENISMSDLNIIKSSKDRIDLEKKVRENNIFNMND